MKTLCIVLFASLIPVAAATEVSLGGNLRTSLTTARDETVGGADEIRVTEYGIGLIPSFIIAPGLGKVEIVPAGGFAVGVGTIKTDRAGRTDKTDTTFVAGGAGCGLFFRLVNGTVLRFSAGPDVWFWLTNPHGDDNNIFETSVGLPVNVDLLVLRRFFLRISSRLVRIGYGFDQGDDLHTFTIFDIHSLLNPEFGFYITF